MIQEALFAMPVKAVEAASAKIPPSPPKPVMVAEPLGECVKEGCSEPATLRSPSGTLYCSKHGYCARRTCLRSVEKMVWHERLGIHVCACVVKFEYDMQEYHEEVKMKEEVMKRSMGTWEVR